MRIPNPFKYIRIWWRKRQLSRSLRVLDAVDWHMIHAGWTRTQRRQFWRDFIKKQKLRTDVFNELTPQ